METKHRSSNNAESAQCPGREFRQVIARDVFHYFAAAARECTVWQSNGDTDDQVPQSAKTQTQRAAVIGGEHAADGGLARPERVERQPLAVLRERFLQFVKRAAGFDAYCQV